ncbi:DUF397 domain-containing protein [Streptomyces sp. NPDC048172]|uniref:DUF397 domain-containing protein n=1 Tax=Streptomyces sp. NPDC048172 TaxID=3365505 RepID=UPI0037181D23
MTALIWRTSSYSGAQGDCVEVADTGTGTGSLVRDSKAPHGPVLAFPPAAWAAFVVEVKAGPVAR